MARALLLSGYARLVVSRPVLFPKPNDRVAAAVEPGAGYPVGVICSLATGRHRELLAETAPTLFAYGFVHHWDVVISSEDLADGRPPAWAKVSLMSELLKRYEYVLWIDADALIVDLNRDLLAEVVDDSFHDVWLARHPQERNDAAQVPNAGVFLARSSPFARALLEEIWSLEEYVEHNWWENAALVDLLGQSLEPPYPVVRSTAWQERVGILDLAWNSVPGYCESPTPAINHHARSDHDDFGLRLSQLRADRVEAMQRFPDAFNRVRRAGPLANQ
jgi:hypothetical protein